MQSIIGLDGCASGWAIASKNIKSDLIEFHLISQLDQLNDMFKQPYLIAIDMPVHLINLSRSVDQKARVILGKRASTVFNAPSINALKENNFQTASLINFELTGKKLSKQSFNLFNKIREVQNFKNSNPAIRIYESHPELAFMKLNENLVVLEKKKTTEGKIKRIKLLQSIFDSFDFENLRAKFNKNMIKNDDILDSFAMLYVALKIYNRCEDCIMDDVFENVSISF